MHDREINNDSEEMKQHTVERHLKGAGACVDSKNRAVNQDFYLF
jgi:hypothetical protein